MTDPSPDASAPASDEASAAWAAVHEARRGINAAWASVIINTLVVLAAVGIPYLQRGWQEAADQRSLRRSYGDLRATVDDDVKNYVIFAADQRRRTQVENAELPVPGRARAYAVGQLKLLMDFVLNDIDDTKFQFSNIEDQNNLKKFVAMKIAMNRTIASAIGRKMYFIENKQDLRYADIDNGEVTAFGAARNDLINLLATVKANEKKAIRSDDDIAIVECDRDDSSPYCLQAARLLPPNGG